jgi:hypothetical protein
MLFYSLASKPSSQLLKINMHVLLIFSDQFHNTTEPQSFQSYFLSVDSPLPKTVKFSDHRADVEVA